METLKSLLRTPSNLLKISSNNKLMISRSMLDMGVRVFCKNKAAGLTEGFVIVSNCLIVTVSSRASLKVLFAFFVTESFCREGWWIFVNELEFEFDLELDLDVELEFDLDVDLLLASELSVFDFDFDFERSKRFFFGFGGISYFS